MCGITVASILKSKEEKEEKNKEEAKEVKEEKVEEEAKELKEEKESREDKLFLEVKERSARIRHRGPDHSGYHRSNFIAYNSTSRKYKSPYTIMAHERLAIVDGKSGSQPLYNEDGSLVLTVNGEIYNHLELKASELKQDHKFATGSDCEIILHLVEEYKDAKDAKDSKLKNPKDIELKDAKDAKDIELKDVKNMKSEERGELLSDSAITTCLNKLRGMFAFILLDDVTGKWIAARDHIGMIPFCFGVSRDGVVWGSSELLAIHDACVVIEDLEPGHYITSDDLQTVLCDIKIKTLDDIKTLDLRKIQRKWYNPTWHNPLIFKKSALSSAMDCSEPLIIDDCMSSAYEEYNDYYGRECKMLRPVTDGLYDLISKKVAAHMMGDQQVKFACFNSGGLDSSIILSCLARRCRELTALDGIEREVHSFTIGVGMPESPTEGDLHKAEHKVDKSSKIKLRPVGLDLPFARRMAEHTGAIHHEHLFTVDEALAIYKNVIKHQQTYDVTTCRAGTPMFLISEVVRRHGFKMVLSGEGSDELFGGYLYFHKCPSAEEMQKELVRKLQLLHKFDCLRANKAPAAWSVEVRPPLLDRDVIEYVMEKISPYEKLCGKIIVDKIEKMFGRMVTSPVTTEFINAHRSLFESPDSGFILSTFASTTSLTSSVSSSASSSDFSTSSSTSVLRCSSKRAMEKWILRLAFEKDLPADVVWRQKEQFSDSVGYSWIDSIRAHASIMISDEKFSAAAEKFPFNTPPTKEAYWVREMFESLFPGEHCAKLVIGGKSIACSTAAAIEWDKSFAANSDPSGRAMAGVHHSAYASDRK